MYAEAPIPAKISRRILRKLPILNSSIHNATMPKFVPRIRKHKVLARQKQESERESAGTYDANTVEILPADKREREEKKRALREQLAIENAGKMSGKKKKRLDKYIAGLL